MKKLISCFLLIIISSASTAVIGAPNFDLRDQMIRSSLEKRFLEYEIQKLSIHKDKILTRTMQFYLNNRNNIPTDKSKYFQGIYTDMISLRKFLFKKDWKNHQLTLNKIKLKVLL